MYRDEIDSEVPDRRPREPDDLIDRYSRSAYAVESEDDYRCPHCGYIGTATLHIASDPGGAECGDVECRECGADTLSERRDLATGCACQKCFHAYSLEGGDYCYSCEIDLELSDVSDVPRILRMREADKPLPSLYDFLASMFRDLYGVRS